MRHLIKLRDRNLYSLKNYLFLFPLTERNKVLTVTIDMYETYMTLIKELFTIEDLNIFLIVN